MVSRSSKRPSLKLQSQWLVVSLTLAVLTEPATAATWTVESDPEQPEGRIGGVVAQAAPGDTILIGPGLYYEHIELPAGDWTFIGREGATATILDGERDAPGGHGSIFYTEGFGEGALRLVQLTLQHGRGYQSSSVCQGGAVRWSGDLVVQSCVFRENEAGNIGLGTGGAIANVWGSTHIADSEFHENHASYLGSAVYAKGYIAVSASLFRSDGGTAGLVWVHGGVDSPALIEDCTFVAGAGPMCEFLLSSAVVRSSTFHGSGVTVPLAFTQIGTVPPDPSTVTIEDNVFWNDVYAAGIDFTREGLVVAMSGNTMHRVGVNGVGLASCTFDRNIVYEALSYFSCDGQLDLVCNDFWPDAVEVGPGTVVSEYGNFALDPLFCDGQIADGTLRADSPCAPEHSPTGCGLIGARPVGCDAVPLETMSWGRLKWWMLDKAMRFRR